MADYAKLGINAVAVMPATSTPAAWIDAIAPIVPQLSALG
jgi:hypothetical protein